MDGTYESRSELETESLGLELSRSLHAGDVVAYYGGLGMGKTAFTRGLARGLGVTGYVTSPTFNIVNEYFGKIPLFHFDVYRLTDSEELWEIGWADYLERGGICAVEWSERVEDALPENAVRVTFQRGGQSDTGRVITIKRKGGGAV